MGSLFCLGVWRGRCILYTMRRTQLYLDDQLWNVLHARALSTGTTVSELVRESLRKHYLGDLEKRRQAMQAIVGIRKDVPDSRDAESEIRELRSGDRLSRIRKA